MKLINSAVTKFGATKVVAVAVGAGMDVKKLIKNSNRKVLEMRIWKNW